VSAGYLGDGNFSGSTSAMVAQSVVSPTVTLSPTTLMINQKVGTTSAPRTVTLTNSGPTTLIISSVAISADFAIASGTTCLNGGTLAAGAKCQINVTFKPTAKGFNNGNLTITDNALASPRTVTLFGHGI
jgi:hypothetical protein